MQIIFVKDYKKQGRKGEIKEVKAGYAENFLIKNGYAVIATKENLRELAHEEKKLEKEDKINILEAEKVKIKLEKEVLEFIVKTGKDDRVFGSISQKQIKEELQKKGYKIDKKQIELTNNITSLGYHKVIIKLYNKVDATIKIHVVK